jgi:hypothetical protein
MGFEPPNTHFMVDFFHKLSPPYFFTPKPCWIREELAGSALGSARRPTGKRGKFGSWHFIFWILKKKKWDCPPGRN